MSGRKKMIEGAAAGSRGFHPVVIVLGGCVIIMAPLIVLPALVPGHLMGAIGAIGVAFWFGAGLLHLICVWLSWCFPPSEPQPPPPSRKGRKKRRST